MSDNGKSHAAQPMDISRKEYYNNFDRIFKKKYRPVREIMKERHIPDAPKDIQQERLDEFI